MDIWSLAGKQYACTACTQAQLCLGPAAAQSPGSEKGCMEQPEPGKGSCSASSIGTAATQERLVDDMECLCHVANLPPGCSWSHLD